MTILGIDCGYQGGISLLQEKPLVVLEYYSMPTKNENKRTKLDEEELLRILLEIKNKYHFKRLAARIENQHTRPGQGVVSGGSIKYQEGLIRGILLGLSIPFKGVEPNLWQKKVLGDKRYNYSKLISLEVSNLNIKDTKKKAISIVQYLFPNVILKKRTRYLDGIADSILIALYDIEYDN